MNTVTLTTRMITDSQITLSVVLVKRTDKTAFVQINNGQVVRCKIKRTFDGRDFIMPYGTYSMAPIFNLN